MSMTCDEKIAVIAGFRDGRTIQARITKAGLLSSKITATATLTEQNELMSLGAIRLIRQLPAIGEWEDIAKPILFDFISYDYRIKPEPPKPREWWINIFHDQYTHHNLAHNTRAVADACATTDSEHRVDCIHVREVLPEEQ